MKSAPSLARFLARFERELTLAVRRTPTSDAGVPSAWRAYFVRLSLAAIAARRAKPV